MTLYNMIKKQKEPVLETFSFEYYGKDRKLIDIEIQSDTINNAVMILFDRVGIVQFGCISSAGKFYNDTEFELEKNKWLRGC